MKSKQDEDVERMARKLLLNRFLKPKFDVMEHELDDLDAIERRDFESMAHYVLTLLDEALRDERESCAALADKLNMYPQARSIAEAIRRRGDTP